MLIMGSRVSHNILDAVDILKNQDIDGAAQIIAEDQRINEQRYRLEANCLSLIATQNPIARDLRTVAAVLEIVTELERINDYAKGIAKVTIIMGKEPLLRPTPDLPRMAVKAQGMLRRALNICERVIFTVTGKLVELDGDFTSNLLAK